MVSVKIRFLIARSTRYPAGVILICLLKVFSSFLFTFSKYTDKMKGPFNSLLFGSTNSTETDKLSPNLFSPIGSRISLNVTSIAPTCLHCRLKQVFARVLLSTQFRFLLTNDNSCEGLEVRERFLVYFYDCHALSNTSICKNGCAKTHSRVQMNIA